MYVYEYEYEYAIQFLHIHFMLFHLILLVARLLLQNNDCGNSHTFAPG